MKILQGIRPCGAFIFRIWWNISKNFSFRGPIPLPLLLHAKFYPPIGATCGPCGAKNLVIALWVTHILALCAGAMLPVKSAAL